MKKQFKISGFSLGAAALLLLSACNDGMDLADGTGTISPLVSYDPTVITARSNGARAAEIGDIEARDLTLTLTAEDGSVSYSGLLEDFDTGKGFNIGKYTLTASYGNPDDEGFEKPAVFGEAELSVLEGQQTDVQLTAMPSKAMVSFTFDKALTDYMTSCTAQVRSAGGTTLEYTSTETRPIYVKPGSATVSVSFVKPNGMPGTMLVNTIDAQARHHYKVNLTLGGDGAGKESITVKYDDLLEEEEVIVDISDQMLSTPAPEVAASGFTDGQLFSLIQGDPFNTSARFDITARGGIESAVLTTRGVAFLQGTDWPAEIDLAKATPAQQQTLTSLGFKDLGILRNPGMIAAFDLSGVVSHIPAGGTEADPVEFSLTVTDKDGRQSQPVGFKVKVEQLTLRLSAPDALYEGGETVDIYATYNGTTPIEQAVKLQYVNNHGVEADAEIISASPRARAANEYVLCVKVPKDARTPLIFKATCASIQSEVTIESAPTLSANANDVFATSAWVSLSHPTYNCADKTIKLFTTDNGTDFTREINGTQSGAEFHATGLEPATTYNLRAKVDGVFSAPFTITTEAAAQIENGNLNDGWGSTKKGSHNLVSAPSPWATLNELSAGGNSDGTNKYAHPNSAESTTDAQSGNAALLRAVAYGFGGHTSGLYNTDHCTPGKLFLGTYADQSGMAFTSRPSSLKFHYKYAPYKSGETGFAEVKVLDANGNVIASGNRTLGSAGSYQQVEIPLTYNRNAAKAAKISVMFRSTAEQIDGSYVKEPAKTLGVIKGCFYGASLYIDEVELGY